MSITRHNTTKLVEPEVGTKSCEFEIVGFVELIQKIDVADFCFFGSFHSSGVCKCLTWDFFTYAFENSGPTSGVLFCCHRNRLDCLLNTLFVKCTKWFKFKPPYITPIYQNNNNARIVININMYTFQACSTETVL